MLLELRFFLVHPNQHKYAKRYKAQRYYLPKSIIKNYNIINGNFHMQTIDSDVKK